MPFVNATDGESLQVLSDRVQVKVASASSPYRLSVVTVDVVPGGFVPLCSHDLEEEVYVMLEGRLQVTLGEQTRELAPGDLMHVPPDTPHAYANPGDAPVRFLAITVGGPIDRFFADLAAEVQQMPRDAERMFAVMERYRVRPRKPAAPPAAEAPAPDAGHG